MTRRSEVPPDRRARLDRIVDEAIDAFFAEARRRGAVPRCGCPRPMPGRFDTFGWTSCQLCGKVLGRADFIDRRPPEGTP